MAEKDRRPIVAGIDFSRDSIAAASYAAGCAARGGQRLDLVAVVRFPATAGPDTSAGLALADTTRRTRSKLDTLAHALATEFRPLSVATDILVGEPAEMLVDRASSAALVAVGALGASGASGRRWGRTSARICAQAQCPVVIVRDDQDTGPPRGGPVIVGALEDNAAAAGIAFAATIAGVHAGDIIAVHPPGHTESTTAGGGTRHVIASAPTVGTTVAELAQQRHANLVVLETQREPWPSGLPGGPTLHAVICAIDRPIAVIDPHHHPNIRNQAAGE